MLNIVNILETTGRPIVLLTVLFVTSRWLTSTISRQFEIHYRPNGVYCVLVFDTQSSKHMWND